jgi:putative ABC transport system substrate-binding protein
MELVREIAPGAHQVGLLTNLQDPKAPPQAQELEAAAKVLEVTIKAVDVNKTEEIDGAMQALASQRVDVVIVLQTTLLLSLGRRIAELALAKRLPTIYGYREHVLAGGLMSYGVDLRWCYRHSAYFVDKILHGTPPGDLPVEFPNQMMLSVNLKTAKALAVKISEAFLLRADEVIE